MGRSRRRCDDARSARCNWAGSDHGPRPHHRIDRPARGNACGGARPLDCCSSEPRRNEGDLAPWGSRRHSPCLGDRQRGRSRRACRRDRECGPSLTHHAWRRRIRPSASCDRGTNIGSLFPPQSGLLSCALGPSESASQRTWRRSSCRATAPIPDQLGDAEKWKSEEEPADGYCEDACRTSSQQAFPRAETPWGLHP